MQLSLPRLVVGGDYEGGLTPVACPLVGALPYMGIVTVHSHICVVLICN